MISHKNHIYDLCGLHEHSGCGISNCVHEEMIYNVCKYTEREKNILKIHMYVSNTFHYIKRGKIRQGLNFLFVFHFVKSLHIFHSFFVYIITYLHWVITYFILLILLFSEHFDPSSYIIAFLIHSLNQCLLLEIFFPKSLY